MILIKILPDFLKIFTGFWAKTLRVKTTAIISPHNSLKDFTDTHRDGLNGRTSNEGQ